MSVLIKYMKMPTSCEDCPLEYYDENYYGDESNHRCPLIYKGYTSNNRYEKRRDDCPLVPVSPHGDLIDRDKIVYFKDDSNLVDFDYAYRSQINSIPTIIPAEEGE